MNTTSGYRLGMVLALACTGLATAAVRADEAADVFNSLYGEEYKRVAASRDVADDVALANKLFSAAASSKDQPQLVAVLCEKIWELASKDSAGVPALLGSQRLLERVAPASRQAMGDKLLDALQKAYTIAKPPQRGEAGEALVAVLEERADAKARAGDLTAAADLLRKAVGVAGAIASLAKDDIQNRLAALQFRQKTLAQIELLQAGLRASPNDKASREKIIYAYLVDLDDPAAAGKLLSADCEESLRTYVPLAGGSPEALAEEACLELAGWYDSLSKRTPAARLPMLLRSRAYYAQYLRKHKAADLAAKKVELQLKDLDEILAKLSPALALRRPVFADPAITEAFEKAIDFLWAAQKEDGSWKEYPGFQTGSTALIALAMLESGCSPHDPRLGKSLKWLSSQKTNQTYVLALRCNCWTLAGRALPGAFADELRRDVGQLASSTADGSFRYTCMSDGKLRDGDNSNSQYGLSGVAAGAAGKVDVPRKFWEAALLFWSGRQNSDGGWGYYGRDMTRATMTAAGLTSLLICNEQLGKPPEAALQTPPVREAVSWLEKHHADVLRDVRGEFHYYLYTLARAGTLAGTTVFGAVDWYKTGAEALRALQNPDGSWEGKYGPEISAAHAILFLAKGARLPQSSLTVQPIPSTRPALAVPTTLPGRMAPTTRPAGAPSPGVRPRTGVIVE
jgi:hypothetical protein